jgi:hypothetical protein
MVIVNPISQNVKKYQLSHVGERDFLEKTFSLYRRGTPMGTRLLVTGEERGRTLLSSAIIMSFILALLSPVTIIGRI